MKGEARTTESVRQHDTDLARIDGVSEAGSEETDSEKKDVADDVEADPQPPLYHDSHVVRSVLLIEAPFGLGDETRLYRAYVNELATRTSTAR